MSEITATEQQSGSTAAASASVHEQEPTPTTAPPQQPASPHHEPAFDPTKPPAWLGPRLQEAKETAVRSLLKGLGVEKPEELTSKLSRLSELEQAQMTEAERSAARVKELEPKAERLVHVEKLLTDVVDAQFKALPEQVRTAIDQQANGDPEKRLQILSVMQASGLLKPSEVPARIPPESVAPALPSPSVVAVASPPSPAHTAPPGTPPPSAESKTAFQQWNEMPTGTVKNLFYRTHLGAIEASRTPAGQ